MQVRWDKQLKLISAANWSYESHDCGKLIQVEPEHLLLGMMAVSGTSGCFGKVSIEAAKREVQSTLNPGKIRPPASPHQKDPEFSAHAKKLFESAQIVSESQIFGITYRGQPNNTQHAQYTLHSVPSSLAPSATGVQKDRNEYDHS